MVAKKEAKEVVPVTPELATKVEQRCRAALRVTGFSHPAFLLAHSRLRYRVETGGGGGGTMAMTNTGVIIVDPSYSEKLDREEIAGVICHEILHLVLLHHGRKGGRDPWRWNIATDMCINKALQEDGIKLPKDVVLPPSEYQGDLFAEALYEWLSKEENQKSVPKPNADGTTSPGRGCSVIDEGEGCEGTSDSPDWKQVAMEMRAVAQAAGRGSSGLSHLLSPREAKINWRQVIRQGFELAAGKPGRDYQTFAKKHRRSPVEGPQFPGWRGHDPQIAMAIDVSGSMDRKWIDEIVSESKSLIKTFQGVRLFLVAHTSEVVWEGWVDQNTQGKFEEAVQFSGGTDPGPAYDAIRKTNKKFSVLIHFTDTCFFAEWPSVPAKKLIVGNFLREVSTQPPQGSTVIMISPD